MSVADDKDEAPKDRSKRLFGGLAIGAVVSPFVPKVETTARIAPMPAADPQIIPPPAPAAVTATTTPPLPLSPAEASLKDNLNIIAGVVNNKHNHSKNYIKCSINLNSNTMTPESEVAIEAQLRAGDYSQDLKTLRPEIEAFYKENLPHFAAYHQALQNYFANNEGRNDLAQDLRKWNARKYIIGPDNPNYEDLDPDLKEEEAATRKKAQERMRSLEAKWGGSTDFNTANTSSFYIALEISNHSEQSFIRNEVRLHAMSAMQDFFGVYGKGFLKNGKPNELNPGVEPLKALLFEIQHQLEDTVLEHCTGHVDENRVHVAYRCKPIEIPFFFPSDAHSLTMQAYDKRMHFISLSELVPYHGGTRNNWHDVSPEKGKIIEDLQNPLHEQWYDVRVPIKRGLDDAGLDAYFMACVKKYRPQDLAACEQIMAMKLDTPEAQAHHEKAVREATMSLEKALKVMHAVTAVSDRVAGTTPAPTPQAEDTIITPAAAENAGASSQPETQPLQIERAHTLSPDTIAEPSLTDEISVPVKKWTQQNPDSASWVEATEAEQDKFSEPGIHGK